MSEHVYEHPSLSSQRDLRTGKRDQERMLSPGPWCWPDKHVDRDAYDSARDAVGAPPRFLEPGEVAFVTLDTSHGVARAELWALQIRPEPRPPSNGVFTGEAREAWLDAQCALPRSLPVLWGAVSARHDQLGPVLKLYSERTGSSSEIDDRSLGLAFGLALASSVLAIQVPGDVIAIASLDESGALGRVDGLNEMLRAIDQLALSVKRVVVASAQHDEARAELESLRIDRLELLSYSTLSAALDALLDDPARAIDAATPEQQRALVDSFFRLAIGERHASLQWGPIERAAERALSKWGANLEPHQRRALEFTQAIAARHHYKRGTLTLPSDDWLDWFPNPLRLRVLAHATQQACDTGAPDPKAILDLTRKSCPELSPLLDATFNGDIKSASLDPRRLDDCFAPHLRLLGAIGRMRYSAQGDLLGAIYTQLMTCIGWQRFWEYDETTYPLSALFTYVSALAVDPGGARQAPALFERIDALWAESQRGGRHCREDPYVRLARGRALATLMRYDEASAELDPLVNNLSRQAEQLRLSAARWRLRCPNPGPAANALAMSSDPRAALYKALRDLDSARSDGDAGKATASAERVYNEQTSLCETLLKGAGLKLGDADAPAFLARRYPY